MLKRILILLISCAVTLLGIPVVSYGSAASALYDEYYEHVKDRDVTFTLYYEGEVTDAKRLVTTMNDRMLREDPSAAVAVIGWEYTLWSGERTTLEMKMHYTLSKRTEEDILDRLAPVVEALTTGKTTDYGKALAIHDWVLERVSYDETLKRFGLDDAWEGSAVCQGYTALYHEMCKLAGLESGIVFGTLEGVDHSWNLVRIDGAWYHVDTTNDDSAMNTHRHFLKADGTMRAQQPPYLWDASDWPATPALDYAPNRIEPPLPTTGPSPFPDVAGDRWSAAAVRWGEENGFVSGYPDGTFKPERSVTQAEFAALLLRAMENVGSRDGVGHWAQGYFDYLASTGVTYLKHKDAAISRGDVARLIAAKNGFDLTREDAVRYMLENGLSSGMGTATGDVLVDYGASLALTREQAVAFLKKLVEGPAETRYLEIASAVAPEHFKGLGLSLYPLGNGVVLDAAGVSTSVATGLLVPRNDRIPQLAPMTVDVGKVPGAAGLSLRLPYDTADAADLRNLENLVELNLGDLVARAVAQEVQLLLAERRQSSGAQKLFRLNGLVWATIGVDWDGAGVRVNLYRN